MARTKEKATPKQKATESAVPRAGAVKTLLEKVEKGLSGKDVKATVADYIRLVQLQKELEEGEAKEITVTWIDPEEEHQDTGE